MVSSMHSFIAFAYVSTAAFRNAGFDNLLCDLHTSPSVTNKPSPANRLDGKNAVPFFVKLASSSIKTCFATLGLETKITFSPANRKPATGPYLLFTFSINFSGFCPISKALSKSGPGGYLLEGFSVEVTFWTKSRPEVIASTVNANDVDAAPNNSSGSSKSFDAFSLPFELLLLLFVEAVVLLRGRRLPFLSPTVTAVFLSRPREEEEGLLPVSSTFTARQRKRDPPPETKVTFVVVIFAEKRYKHQRALLCVKK